MFVKLHRLVFLLKPWFIYLKHGAKLYTLQNWMRQFKSSGPNDKDSLVDQTLVTLLNLLLGLSKHILIKASFRKNPANSDFPHPHLSISDHLLPWYLTKFFILQVMSDYRPAFRRNPVRSAEPELSFLLIFLPHNFLPSNPTLILGYKLPPTHLYSEISPISLLLL